MADKLSTQIQNHINKSIKEGVGEIKFRAGPVKITYFADEGRGVIDVVSDVVKDPYKLKEHFNKVRKALPKGLWELNPDTPQKQRIYERWFKKDPNIKPSGDKGMQKIGREGFVLNTNKTNIMSKSASNFKFNDEQAHVNMWNHMLRQPGFRQLVQSGDTQAVNNAIRIEIQKAHHSPKHPLNFKNVKNVGFDKGGKTPNHYKSYTSRLNNSGNSVAAMLNTRSGRNMAINGYTANRVGGEHKASRPNWKGQSKGQGRADIEYTNPLNPKSLHTQSVKSAGGSQAASGEGSQTKATIMSAIKTLTKDKNVINSVNKEATIIGNLMQSMRGKDKSGADLIQNQIKTRLTNLSKQYPGLDRAFGLEALTGKSQFGKPVNTVLTVGDKGASVLDPRGIKVESPRISKGKGGLDAEGLYKRPGVVRLDIKPTNRPINNLKLKLSRLAGADYINEGGSDVDSLYQPTSLGQILARPMVKTVPAAGTVWKLP